MGRLAALAFGLVAVIVIGVLHVGAVRISLADCGILRLHYVARPWSAAAPDPLLPPRPRAAWRSYGLVTAVSEDRLSSRDHSGTKVTFRFEDTPTNSC